MLRAPSWILAPSLALAVVGAGCAGETQVQVAAPAPAAKPAAAKPAAAAPGRVTRAEVDRVLTQMGPAWIFRRVLREETFDKEGRFAGWRLTGLPQEWIGIDLKPGDVVTKVNGSALETPDQAWEAWKSVAKLKEIRIQLERGGKAQEVVIPIDGEPSAETARMMERDAPPPRAPQPAGKPRGVVHIGADPPVEVEDHESY
uniref:PDZ domain-containing protein n=1 Tax=Phaselicystis flava TaxID=525924 RepID=A0A3S7V092_9BACT|nr:hypothetical protein [Phaselicystis flava]